MINKIKIKNFQSHKNTELNLHKGINIITGKSRSGKSSIMRSLVFCKDNRPNNKSYISYWNRDKKGESLKETSVEIIKNNDAVSIKRERKKDFNGYILETPYDTTSHNAIKTSVPDEIMRAMNLSEVNLQKQYDSPFLLSDNSIEVARFFNKIIKLDISDKILSKAESIRIKINQEIKSDKKTIEKAEKELDELSWVDNASKLFDEIYKLKDDLGKKEDFISDVFDFINKINQAKDKLEAFNKIDETITFCEKINKLNESIKNRNDKAVTLFFCVQDIKKINESLYAIPNDIDKVIKHIGIIETLNDECKDNYFDLEKLSDLKLEIMTNKNWLSFFEENNIYEAINKANKILEIKKKQFGLKKDVNDFLERIDMINDCVHRLNIVKKEIEELESKIPKVCPYCGNIIKKCNHQEK